MSSRPDPVGANVAVLEQTLALIDRLDDAQYVHVDEALAVASIGAHVRHNLDHYRLFLVGLVSGTVDYDARERGTAVECDRASARAEVLAVIDELRALPVEVFERVLRVHQQDGERPGCCDGCESRVDRELLFLQSHAVHHHALMAVLARAQGLLLPATFGMAPSTISWLEQQRVPDGAGLASEG